MTMGLKKRKTKVEREAEAAANAAATAREEEVAAWIKKHKLDESQYSYIHDHGDKVHSANWGNITTHLMIGEYLMTPPDCDRMTLCGKYLPDGERYYYEIVGHPRTDAAETYCPKCLAAIDPYRLTREILSDERWWEAHQKFKAGQEYNYKPPYQLPPLNSLSRTLKMVLELRGHGKDFQKHGFAFSSEYRDGEWNMQMRLNGALAWAEVRRPHPDTKSAFVSRLVVEPKSAVSDSSYLRLADYVAGRGQARIAKSGREVYGSTQKFTWPKNSACVMSREQPSEPFAITFDQRDQKDLQEEFAASISQANSGDPKHPLYALAVKINEQVRACLANRGKVLAYGEEGYPMKFVAAVATSSAGFSHGLHFTYTDGGKKCGTVVPAEALVFAERQIQRGCLSVRDEDEEPFKLEFIGLKVARIQGGEVSLDKLLGD